jgi:regulator of protease activity HflC (stomatin/prohibitin superfamily)
MERAMTSVPVDGGFMRSGRRIGVAAAAFLVVLGVAGGSYYTVPQTELAYVTQFGRVVNRTGGPIGPGLHFKLPLIQSVDTLRITRDTDPLGEVTALTKDTQAVTLNVSVTTSVPPSAVYHLLYEVGRAGNLDLKHNYDATLLTELRNVMGRHSIVEIAGEDRANILAEFQAAASAELQRLYGTTVDQVQVSVEKMPETYVQRINQAMLSQAAILQSQRDQERAKIDAETARITAAGLANKAIEEARGRAQSNLLEAQAQAQAIELRGKAEADAKRLLADALSQNPALVEYQKALAWNGQLPSAVYANAPIPFFAAPATH